ncbi:MAG: DUF4160 domain-containing protein [Limisphaerales bacterium]
MAVVHCDHLFKDEETQQLYLTEPHHKPHFHGQYQKHAAVFTFDPVDMIEGSFPNAQRRLVEAWAELHKVELAQAWDSLMQGRRPDPIDPLK